MNETPTTAPHKAAVQNEFDMLLSPGDNEMNGEQLELFQMNGEETLAENKLRFLRSTLEPETVASDEGNRITWVEHFDDGSYIVHRHDLCGEV